MKIRSTTIVEASAPKAWEVVGNQFGEFGDWAGNLLVTHLEGELGVGGIRVCQTAGFGPFAPAKFKEELIQFDPTKLTYAYKATSGLPPIFVSAQNQWQVKSLGSERSEITFCATMCLKWWARPLALIFPTLMAKDFRLFTEEMKYRIEHGRPHPRKLKIQMKATRVTS